MLKVYPVTSLNGWCTIPSSKPETQRAILAASLGMGKTKIYNDLRCVETEVMKNACKIFGAQIQEYPEYLEIEGISGKLKCGKKIIDCKGSGLVFRIFLALSSMSTTPVVLTGDATLRKRIVKPLYDALLELGAKLEYIIPGNSAPIINWGGQSCQGGVCHVQGDVSSQFITALLFAAPLTSNGITVNISGKILSKSYIMQTLEVLEDSGINCIKNDDLSYIKVFPGVYATKNRCIVGDYTSASYLLAAATLFKGTFVLKNISSISLQGEKAIISMLKKMGIVIEHDDENKTLTAKNSAGRIQGDFEFDVSDCPNIIPTLASIGAYVDGVFRVTGGSITQLHKSPRIEAMISELMKMGVNIKPILRHNTIDGFEIRGRASYEGGVNLSSWGDHRIFMSLFVASLKVKKPNLLSGYEDTDCSFPGFFSEFKSLGVTFESVKKTEVDTDFTCVTNTVTV